MTTENKPCSASPQPEDPLRVFPPHDFEVETSLGWHIEEGTDRAGPFWRAVGPLRSTRREAVTDFNSLRALVSYRRRASATGRVDPATIALLSRDMRCPDCCEMMTNHVVVTRHESGPCDETMTGPPLSVYLGDDPGSGTATHQGGLTLIDRKMFERIEALLDDAGSPRYVAQCVQTLEARIRAALNKGDAIGPAEFVCNACGGLGMFKCSRCKGQGGAVPRSSEAKGPRFPVEAIADALAPHEAVLRTAEASHEDETRDAEWREAARELAQWFSPEVARFVDQLARLMSKRRRERAKIPDHETGTPGAQPGSPPSSEGEPAGRPGSPASATSAPNACASFRGVFTCEFCNEPKAAHTPGEARRQCRAKYENDSGSLTCCRHDEGHGGGHEDFAGGWNGTAMQCIPPKCPADSSGKADPAIGDRVVVRLGVTGMIGTLVKIDTSRECPYGVDTRKAFGSQSLYFATRDQLVRYADIQWPDAEKGGVDHG